MSLYPRCSPSFSTVIPLDAILDTLLGNHRAVPVEPYLKAVDEYTSTQALRDIGGEIYLDSVMGQHYETFITEQDFTRIAQAGFHYVRIGFNPLQTY